MTRVAIKGLVSRKLRTLLTTLAIVLGVAMVSGSLILTDTVTKAFDEIFVASRDETTVVVSGKEVVENSASGPATVPEGLLESVQDVPDVAAAAGAIEDSAQIVGKDGKAVTTVGAPTLGLGLDFSQPRFFGWTLAEGNWPSNSGEVVIDRKTAASEDFGVGDTISVATLLPAKEFRVTGIAGFGDLESIGGATAAIFDIPTAQELFGKAGKLDSISAAAKDGVTPEALASEIAPLLPASAQVKTAAEQAKSDSEQVTSGLGLLRYFLLAFAGVSVFVGAFVIFNTFSITVAQRTREFATLRTLGASRAQVLRSIVVESAVIGLVAAVIGLFLGLGLAEGLSALFTAFGFDLPKTDAVFAVRTIIISIGVGTAVAVLAGLVPALRATRVPPIAAVREGATLPRSRLAPYAPMIAGALLAIGVAALAYGMFAGGGTTQRLLLLAVGCLVLFTGVAIISSHIVRPLASVLGQPSAWAAGLSGQLARENSTRSPERTAATAAALMIGLALVTFVASLGQGLRTSISNSISEQVAADFVVRSQSFAGFSVAAGDAVASAEGVEAASSVRGETARIAGSDGTVTGIDPATIGQVFRFQWVDGSDGVLDDLGERGAIVTQKLAKDRGVDVGGSLDVVTPEGTELTLDVAAIVESPPLGGGLTGDVAISQAAFDAVFPTPRNLNTYVDLSGGETASVQSLEQALEPYPDTRLETRAEFIKSQQSTINLLLNLLYVLLALSVIVSLFGMVNTLALSIVERTRELGMLRAIGMSRRQTRRMVRHESVITALIGAVLGLPLGIFLALLVSLALEDEGIIFAVPIVPLVVIALAAIAAGVAAAILPARRAARLNVLQALQYE